MAPEIFSGYEQEFLDRCAATRRSIAAAVEKSELSALAAVETELGSALELLQQMELEARTVPSAQRVELSSRLREHAAEGAMLKKELAQTRAELGRSAKGGGSRSGAGRADGVLPDAAHARMVAAGARMVDEGTARLREAERQVYETESIGASILGDLKAQREVLLHSVGTMHGAPSAPPCHARATHAALRTQARRSASLARSACSRA